MTIKELIELGEYEVYRSISWMDLYEFKVTFGDFALVEGFCEVEEDSDEIIDVWIDIMENNSDIEDKLLYDAAQAIWDKNNHDAAQIIWNKNNSV